MILRASILFSTDDYYKDKILKEKIHDRPSIREVLKGNTVSIIEYDPTPGHEMRHLTVYTHEHGFLNFQGNDWSIILTLDYEKAMLPLTVVRNEMRNSIFATALIIVMVSLLISYLSLSSITKPIKKLTKVANEISRGTLDTKITEIDSKDEIGILSGAFN